jgi:hypothetical protein
MAIVAGRSEGRGGACEERGERKLHRGDDLCFVDCGEIWRYMML